jgi:Bifunctional DNA primase/polymerase, N-terminal/Primase C terminal 2 (PriCT-2)/Protein of unknown function (DUF3987)
MITPPTSEELESALAYARKGWPVFPCGEDKKPLITHGFKVASTNPHQIKAWWERWPGALIGVPMGARSGLFCVDLDRKEGGSDGVATWIQLTTIHETPATLSAVSPSTGEHRYFQFQVGLRSIPLDKLAPGIEIKAEGGYMILPPSKRNVGTYKWTNGADIAPPPQWLLDRIKAHYVRQPRTTPTEAVAPQRISEALAHIDPDIGRAEWFAIGCALFSELKESGFAVWNEWSSRGDKYVSDEMERQWASIAQANGYAYTIGTLFYHAQNAGWTNVVPAELNKPGTPEDGGQHARQEEPWPEIRAEAYHGFAGELVETISPHSEADPVALLVQTLVCAGNIIERDCYFQVESDRHHANLFAALVGESSKARKGVSWSRVKAVAQYAAFEWERDRIQTGLSSGEGLIHAVRDPSTKVNKDGDPIDEGVEDKRLLVVESEFASLLSVMERPGNTISSLIRLAWDGGRLATLTRNNPITATDPHISILAHITKDELKARLTRTDMANGFANRFLYLLIRRARELPFGGEDLTDSEIRELGEDLKNKVDLGMSLGEGPRKIVWSEEAKPEWARAYHELSKPRPGLSGAIAQRGEAQVVRLALIYALLDKSFQIEPVHLRAARAVWDYSEASVRYLFGASLGDEVADTILKALRVAGVAGMSRNNMYDLYGRHQSRDRISAALALLFEQKLATWKQEYSRGRPAEIWVAI